jgi:hypothetical protein
MECPICYEDISSDELVVLKCSHKFHYDCIMKEYKTQLDNTNNIKIRICPYCRGYGGYLKMKQNCVPIKYITENYNSFYDYLIHNDYDKIKFFFEETHCFCILKTGPNKGTQCSRTRKPDSLFCGTHAAKSI